MKTMFKKTLVAAALAGLSANAFAAVDVQTSTEPVAYSIQALDVKTAANATVDVAATAFEIELGAEYAVGDVITFTFSNDALPASQLATTITTAGGTADVTLGLLSTTATSATYRVTEVSTALSTIGSKFEIAAGANLSFNAAKLKAGNGFKITYAAQTSNGITIDAGTKSSVQLIYIGDQFKVAAKPVFDGVIDVNADRKKFESNTTVDALTLTTTNRTGVDTDGDGADDLNWVAAVGSVAFNKVAYVVKGDFSWVKDTDTDTPEIDADASTFKIFDTAPVPAVNANCTLGDVKVDSVKFECTDAVAHVFTVDTAQGSVTDPVIPVTSFTYDATVTHTTNKTTSYASGLNAGSWTLNGSQVFVPYMVYGTLNNVAYSQVINVSNNSAKVGDIKVDAWKEDGTQVLTNVKVGEAKANTVTSIAGTVRNLLSDAGVVNGKVSMKITTNVPGKAVTVYSAYTDVDSRERAIVNNDSAVQTKGAALN